MKKEKADRKISVRLNDEANKKVISVMVAVQASCFAGISFWRRSALIKVDLPALIVATTFTSKSLLFAILNALTTSGCLSSSKGPVSIQV